MCKDRCGPGVGLPGVLSFKLVVLFNVNIYLAGCLADLGLHLEFSALCWQAWQDGNLQFVQGMRCYQALRTNAAELHRGAVDSPTSRQIRAWRP